MRKGIGIGLIAAGVALVIVGARADGTSQMVAVFGGFVLSITGVVSLFGGRGDSLETGSGAVTETDTPARVRLLGVFVTLASLGLPYIQLPLGGGGETYSFVGILMGLNSDTITLQALSAGNDLAGGLTLLIFASVVIAGAFASILHHLGGYVVLFGAAGYGYVVSEVTGVAPLQVILSEFRIGLYVAVVGALVIVASSFFSYQTAEKDRSWYGGGG